MNRREIHHLVDMERERQDLEHPRGGKSRAEYMVIIGEEHGEVCRAIIEDDIDQMRDEAIQLIALLFLLLEVYA